MAEPENNARPLIVKRKKVIAGGGHHGGAWKVAIVSPSYFRSRRISAPRKTGPLPAPAKRHPDTCTPSFGGAPPHRVQSEIRPSDVNKRLMHRTFCSGFYRLQRREISWSRWTPAAVRPCAS